MTASATKCHRDDCRQPPTHLLWVHRQVHPLLAIERQEHACEAHAIEDDDAGHVRRAIRLPKE
jgi:hypothetical protein